MTKQKKTKPHRPSSNDLPSMDQKGGIWRLLLKGAVFTVLILGIKVAFEHTETGKQLELAGYILLQQRLTSEPDSVQVVDISDLQPSKVVGRTYPATPRDVLTNLTQAIADQNPRVIGLDIDFSPDEEGYVTPADPDFFQSCLDMNVPVFLGIHRTEPLPPDVWLGDKKFARLAADTVIPYDTRKMPLAIQTSPQASPGTTMGAALASTFEKARCAIGEFLTSAGLANQFSTKEVGQGGSVQEFLVDYGPLDGLMKNRLQTTNPAVIRDQGRLFTDKIVLVGDGSLGKGTDRPVVVAGKSQPVPGVYIHACAAYTLTKMSLYELTSRGRLVIDSLLVAIVLLPIAIITFVLRKERTRTIAVDRLRSLFTVLVVIAAIGLGVVFVYETCVLWTDFIMAIGALVLHPSIEKRLERFWEFIKRTAPRVVRAFVFKREGEK